MPSQHREHFASASCVQHKEVKEKKDATLPCGFAVWTSTASDYAALKTADN